MTNSNKNTANLLPNLILLKLAIYGKIMTFERKKNNNNKSLFSHTFVAGVKNVCFRCDQDIYCWFVLLLVLFWWWFAHRRIKTVYFAKCRPSKNWLKHLLRIRVNKCSYFPIYFFPHLLEIREYFCYLFCLIGFSHLFS